MCSKNGGSHYEPLPRADYEMSAQALSNLPSADCKSKTSDMRGGFCAISLEIASLRVGTAGRQVYLPTSDEAQILKKVECVLSRINLSLMTESMNRQNNLSEE